MDLVLTACGLVPCLGFLLWEKKTKCWGSLPLVSTTYLSICQIMDRITYYILSVTLYLLPYFAIFTFQLGCPNFPQLMHKLDCLSMHLKSNLMISEISKISRFGRTISRVAPVGTYWTFLRIFLHTYLTEKLLLSPALCVQQN